MLGWMLGFGDLDQDPYLLALKDNLENVCLQS